jgi:hypothetical protein
LVRLLAKGTSYNEITNQDILDEANKGSKGKPKVYMQSLYQWFEGGKDTIVSVLAAEYDMIWAEEITAFVNNPIHLKGDAKSFIRSFNKKVLNFYRTHKEAVLIWQNQSIPASLRNPSEAMQQFLVMSVADFLQKRGMGQRRYLIATVMYAVVFFMRELSIRPVFSAKKGFSLFVDSDIEEELEKLLVRYLQPYFDEIKK